MWPAYLCGLWAIICYKGWLLLWYHSLGKYLIRCTNFHFGVHFVRKLFSFSFQTMDNEKKRDSLLKKVEDRLKLDEILDLCADYEREIEAELRLKDLAGPHNHGGQENSVKTSHPTTPLKSPTACVSPLQWSPLSTLHPNRYVLVF